MGFGHGAMAVYQSDIALCEHIKVGVGAGLAHGSATELVGAGHAVVLAASQHQVAEAVANVGVFVFVGCISESFMPCSHSNSLKMITAGK